MIRTCDATLVVGDDFGDNPCTFRCARKHKHLGMHKFEFQSNGSKRILRWDGDARRVHEHPEGGILYYDFDCFKFILWSLLNCLSYDNPEREPLLKRVWDLYDEDEEPPAYIDEQIKESQIYKKLLADLTSAVQDALVGVHSIVEIVKPNPPRPHSEFWLKPVG